MTSVSDLIITDNLTTNTLNVSGLSRFNNDIYAQAEIIVGTNATIRGTINTSSNLNVSGNSILRGNILALSGLNINGISNFQNNVNITGNVNVTGSTYLPSLHLGNIMDVEAAINNITSSSYTISETNNLLSSYYNKTATSTILQNYYDMTTMSNLFVPQFNISSNTPIIVNNNLNINGVLSISGITDLAQTVNNKLNSSVINNYYNITQIDNRFNNSQFITATTATSQFLTITAATTLINHTKLYDVDAKSFNIMDLNQNNVLTASMFVNSYICISNNNTSTIVLPSVYEIIYGLFNGNVAIGTTFPTYISHNLGSLQSLYIQPNNSNPLYLTILSFDFDMHNMDTTLLIGAPGYSRNKYSHHLVTRIDSMTSMTVFKL
jgi:hypothetical protein